MCNRVLTAPLPQQPPRPGARRVGHRCRAPSHLDPPLVYAHSALAHPPPRRGRGRESAVCTQRAPCGLTFIEEPGSEGDRRSSITTSTE